jgi:hypothetical protein
MKRLLMAALGAALVTVFAAVLLPISPAKADGGATCAPTNVSQTGCSSVGVYGTEMRALLAEIAANPTPNVQTIPIDEKLLYARAFRKVVKPGPIYDGPDGNVIGNLDEGFQFVNAGRGQNGWVEIRPGQWLPEDSLGPINKAVSKFAGVLLPDGMPARPFGWVLLDTRPSLTPGARPLKGTPELKRYTLVNIFAVQVVDGWEWYLVGPDQWILQTRVAKIKPVVRPAEITGGKWFSVDLYEQTLVAYDGERPVFATLIASGLARWGTSEGVHKIWDRYEQTRMSGAAGQAEFWYLPQVPFVMYFNKEEQALHGAYWHDGFGFRRSRGCVNMSITDAKWAYDWTQDQPEAFVYIFHSQEYRPGAPQ